MQTHVFDGYTLTMQETDMRMKTGQRRVAYTFTTPDGEVLFEGDDFGASPMHTPEGIDAARCLLGFITLQPGDTDDEYFAPYTPRQRAWAESWECEQLSIYADEDYVEEP